MKRTFFAIKISESTKNLFMQIGKEFPEFYKKIKIANSNNSHITIKFIGDTEEKLIDEIDINLSKEFAELESFTFTCEGTGCFPKPARPSVLWLGINKGLKNIQKIHTLVEYHLENSGIEKDKRRFTPHLTYGRVKKYVDKLESIDDFLNFEFEPTENIIEEVIWFESKLTPQGAIHKPVRIYKLK